MEVNTQTPPELEDDYRQQFIEYGGNPNLKSIRESELAVRNQVHMEYAQRRKLEADMRGRWAEMAREIVTRGMQGVAVALTLVLVLGGMTIALVLLIVAEWAAVEKGFRVIDPSYAGLYSAAAVFFFISTLFIREVIARSATRDDERVFSLRYVAQWLVYFVGFGDRWRPQYRHHVSLLNRVDNAVRWLTYTIVLFGLLGRLAESLMKHGAIPWTEALQKIIEQSTLAEIMGYIGSVVMTIGLLLATHFAIYLIHSVYVQVTGGLNVSASDFLEVSLEDSIEAARRQFWHDQMTMQRQRYLLKAQTKPNDSADS